MLNLKKTSLGYTVYRPLKCIVVNLILYAILVMCVGTDDWKVIVLCCTITCIYRMDCTVIVVTLVDRLLRTSVWRAVVSSLSSQPSTRT